MTDVQVSDAAPTRRSKSRNVLVTVPCRVITLDGSETAVGAKSKVSALNAGFALLTRQRLVPARGASSLDG